MIMMYIHLNSLTPVEGVTKNVQNIENH